jgi:hypothetical protein
MIPKEEADEKVKEGWIRSWMMFEVLAVDETVTKESLGKLLAKLEKDARGKMYSKTFGAMRVVEKPLPNIEKGHSLTCEVELISNKFDDLVQIVTEYGPSATEILEPKVISTSAGEAQSILNTIARMMHEFAAAGAGGIVFIKGE